MRRHPEDEAHTQNHRKPILYEISEALHHLSLHEKWMDCSIPEGFHNGINHLQLYHIRGGDFTKRKVRKKDCLLHLSTEIRHDKIGDYGLKASITFRGLPKSQADAASVRQ